MSTCIIRQLLYEHSEIDAAPSRLTRRRRKQSDASDDDSESSATSTSQLMDDEEEEDHEQQQQQEEQSSSAVQWQALAKDLEQADDPAQVLACDVAIFQVIAKRMPRDQLV